MEFGSGVLDAEAPSEAGLSLVSLQLQSANPPAERIPVRDPLPETIAGEDAEFDLRHIQPTAMLGRAVKIQTPGNPAGLSRRKALIQRGLAAGIEVVQHNSYHRRIRVSLVCQPAHLLGEALGGAPLRYRHMPSARQWLAEEEQVAGALPPVLVILPPGFPGLRRKGQHGRRPATGWRSRRNRPLASEGRKVRCTGPGHPPYGPRTRRSPRECTTVSSATA